MEVDRSKLSKEELLKVIEDQNAQINHLKKQISSESSNRKRNEPSLSGKEGSNSDLSGNEPRKKQKKDSKEIDMSKYSLRHVAIKLSYLGWDYKGLAAQEGQETIEVLPQLGNIF